MTSGHNTIVSRMKLAQNIVTIKDKKDIRIFIYFFIINCGSWRRGDLTCVPNTKDRLLERKINVCLISGKPSNVYNISVNLRRYCSVLLFTQDWFYLIYKIYSFFFFFIYV